MNLYQSICLAVNLARYQSIWRAHAAVEAVNKRVEGLEARKTAKNMGSEAFSQHFCFTLFPGFLMMKTTREQEMRLETQ
jgi:hypothetical protein